MFNLLRCQGCQGCVKAGFVSALTPNSHSQALTAGGSQSSTGGVKGVKAVHVPIADAGTGAHTHTHACIRDRCSDSLDTLDTLAFYVRKWPKSLCYGGLGVKAERGSSLDAPPDTLDTPMCWRWLV